MRTATDLGRGGVYTLKRLQRGLVDFFVGRIVQAAASIALVFVVIRLLSLPDYGAYMVALGLVRMMGPIGSFGLLRASQYFVPQIAEGVARRDRYRFVLALFGARVANLVVIAVFFWVAWEWIAGPLGFSPEQIAASRMVVFLIVSFQCLGFLTMVLECLLELKRARLADTLQPAGRLALFAAAFVLGIDDFTVATVLWIDIAVSTGCAGLALVLVMRRLYDLPGGTGRLPSARQVARQALHFAPVGLLDVFLSRGALRMIVAYFLGLPAVALLGFIQQICAILVRFAPSMLLERLVRPMLISRLDGERGLSLLRDSINILWKSDLLLFGAGAAVLATIGDDLMILLSGGKISGGGASLVLFFLVVLGNGQKNLSILAMQITGQTSQVWKIALLSPVGFAVTAAVAGLGLNAAIVSVAVVLAAWSLAGFGVVQAKHPNVRLEWSAGLRVLAAVAAGAGLGAGVVHTLGDGLFVVLVASTAAAAAYLTTLALLRPVSGDEFAILKRALGPTLSRPVSVFSRA